jgi:hypothetical protein
MSFHHVNTEVPAVVQVTLPSPPTRQPLDDLQAQHTALCFLCAIRASPASIRAFLRQFPQVLLLEGASLLPEESAQHILEPACSTYRSQVGELLRKDFYHYHAEHLKKHEKLIVWDTNVEPVARLEQEIRQKRLEEMALRSNIVQVACQLDSCSDVTDAASLWTCTAKPHEGTNQRASMALELSRLERHHQSLLREIRQARQAQFHSLKSLFAKLPRHECRECAESRK